MSWSTARCSTTGRDANSLSLTESGHRTGSWPVADEVTLMATEASAMHLCAGSLQGLERQLALLGDVIKTPIGSSDHRSFPVASGWPRYFHRCKVSSIIQALRCWRGTNSVNDRRRTRQPFNRLCTVSPLPPKSPREELLYWVFDPMFRRQHDSQIRAPVIEVGLTSRTYFVNGAFAAIGDSRAWESETIQCDLSRRTAYRRSTRSSWSRSPR